MSNILKLLIFFISFEVSNFNTYAHHGDVFAAMEDATSEAGLKSLAVNAISAGVMRGAGLPKPQGLADHLQKNALQSALNVGLKIAVEGADPGDALRQGLINLEASQIF